jgi:hypothetical protein
MTVDDPLGWLMSWYAAQCDGEWEHSYTIRVSSLDNPGWSLEVDLFDTPLQGRPFSTVERDLVDDVSWSRCWTEGERFRAACGPFDLKEVIAIFRDWAGGG